MISIIALRFFLDAEGDRITIFNELDFGIFLENLDLKINKEKKIFVSVPSEATSKQRSIKIRPERTLSTLRERLDYELDSNHLNPFLDRLLSRRDVTSSIENCIQPKSPQPSTSKLNEGVLEQKSSSYGKMVNEKLTEPMRVLSVESDNKDLPNLPGKVSAYIDLSPSESSLVVNLKLK